MEVIYLNMEVSNSFISHGITKAEKDCHIAALKVRNKQVNCLTVN